MDGQLNTCILYIDYEALQVGLSHLHAFNADTLLADLLERARQRFSMQQAIVFGDWTYHMNFRRLENLGFTCYSVAHGDHDGDLWLQSSIARQMATHEAPDVYILVSGYASYHVVLDQIYRAGKESVLWMLTPPPARDQVLCTEWDLIALPPVEARVSWPRQLMLQAIALAADHLQYEVGNPFLLQQLRARLGNMYAFRGRVDDWLDQAIKEQILLLTRAGNPAVGPHVTVNSQHVLVQKALLIREHILLTLSTLLVDRACVAFSELERTLRATRLLAANQRIRQAWLEFLLTEDIIIAEQLPQPGSPFQVEALRLNPLHPAVAEVQRQSHYNLMRLIILMQSFSGRKHRGWIAVSRLLSILATSSTRAEARATISTATNWGIVEVATIPSAQKHTLSTEVTRLQQDHVLVQETLARHDQLLRHIAMILAQWPAGVSEPVLVKELVQRMQITQDDALFWITLLINQGSLTPGTIVLDAEEAVNIIRLSEHDPPLRQLLDEIRQPVGKQR